MTALDLQLPLGVEFCPLAQWRYRVLVQALTKFERVFYPDSFSALKVKANTKAVWEQTTSQRGTDKWTLRVAWPGHEFEVYAKEHDR